MRPIPLVATLSALLAFTVPALAGNLVVPSPAATSLLPKGAASAPAPGIVPKQVQPGGGAGLVKSKLTSLTLAQTTIPPTNSSTVVFSLQGDHPIVNCQLVYELRTNYTGADAINISLINPLDYGSPTGGWTLPIQNQSLSFVTLMDNGNFRQGPLRFFLRAKDGPNNNCTGEAHVDFNIQAAPLIAGNVAKVASAVGPAGGGITAFTTITGVTLAPNWYDFLKKQADIKIQGKGAPQCAYVMEFKNNSTGTVLMWPPSGPAETVLPMEYGDLGLNLAAGTYTVTVKPGKPSNPYNPNIQACVGQASAIGKVSVPANAMGIGSTSMHVTKSNGTTVTQQDISLPMNDLKAISLDVNFTNSMDTLHNTPNGCAYKVVTVWPQGGLSEAYFLAQGVADKGIAINVASPGIEGKGPGKYILRVQGTTQIPGNNQAIPCVGNTFEHQVTLTTTISPAQVQDSLITKP